jgi:guanylate kinase
MPNKTIFCVLGRTASGKDTLVAEMCKKHNLKQLISYTTRPKRNENENTHLFATEQDFNNDCARNAVVASTVINGYTYWSTKDQVYESDVYIIDPRGLEELKRTMPDVRIVTICIYVDTHSRRQRFLIRQPGKDELFEQRNASESEQFDAFELNKMADYFVFNDRFETALYCLDRIITFERNKTNEI